MSRRVKIIATTLLMVVALTIVFTSIAFAADPVANSGLPACCQQQQGQPVVQGCCGQATASYQSAPGGCCGR